jgi:hypothetical protein
MPLEDASQHIEAGLEVLKQYAARGETLTYGDLNRELDTPIPQAGFPGRIGELCDGINRLHEETTGYGFMISALVHGAKTGLPGAGFFKLANTLRRLPLTNDEEAQRVFVSWECESAFAVYRRP